MMNSARDRREGERDGAQGDEALERAEATVAMRVLCMTNWCDM